MLRMFRSAITFYSSLRKAVTRRTCLCSGQKNLGNLFDATRQLAFQFGDTLGKFSFLARSRVTYALAFPSLYRFAVVFVGRSPFLLFFVALAN